MADIKSKVQTAREAGYSDAEIRRFLFSQPAAEEARKAGYSDAEIAAHFGLMDSEGIPGKREIVTPPQQAVGYVEELLGNIPESTLKFAQGVYETATSPVETAKALGAAALSPVQTAKAIGGYAAERYGSPGAIAETLKTDPVGFLADISTVAGGAGAALRRPGLRALSEATSPVNMMAGAVQAPFSAAGYGYEFARNAMAPRYATYLEAVEGRGPQIVEALRSPQAQLVPGSVPTAAQAAAPVGSARFAQLGASAAETLPTEFMERAKQQAAARLAEMRTVGRTEAQLETAKAARASEAGALYQAAERGKPIAETPEFTELMSRPSMDKAMARAAELSAERGQVFQIGKTTPETQVPSPILGPSGETLMQTVPATQAKYPISSFHNLKLAMDDLIRNPERFGIGASEAAAIAKTRGELIGFIKQKSPLYEKARATFAEKSGPINRMEIGQYLESKLLSPLAEEAPQRAGVFATAVEQAPQTIKRALEGAPRFEKLSDVLKPDEVRKVEAIRADLAREAEALRMARAAAQAGPEAARNLQIPRANLMDRVFNVANKVISSLERKIDKRLAIQIATEMLDPQQAAQVIEDAVKYAEETSARGKKIRETGKKVRADVRKYSPEITAAVTIQNALGERKNQNAMARR
jgi:hypothetical protein